jgi:prevent-host-death family protein
MGMRSMPISTFKATCLAVLEEVRQTGEPVIVTKRGAPIAEIVPAGRPATAKRELGGLRGTCQILGDIISPAVSPDEWQATLD